MRPSQYSVKMYRLYTFSIYLRSSFQTNIFLPGESPRFIFLSLRLNTRKQHFLVRDFRITHTYAFIPRPSPKIHETNSSSSAKIPFKNRVSLISREPATARDTEKTRLRGRPSKTHVTWVFVSLVHRKWSLVLRQDTRSWISLRVEKLKPEQGKTRITEYMRK